MRERRRECAAARCAELDLAYVEQFAERVRQPYPHCPPGVESAIAEHACPKYSGRVGRSAAAKALDEDAIRLAVVADLRHTETPYDHFLSMGNDRHEARSMIEGTIHAVLSDWE